MSTETANWIGVVFWSLTAICLVGIAYVDYVGKRRKR